MADPKPPVQKPSMGLAELVASKNKKFRTKSLASDEADYLKILMYGKWGSGKTRALVGFLVAGLRIFVFGTDFGGNGLRTVKEALRDLGREDLLANLQYVDFDNYEDFDYVLEHPESLEIEEADGKVKNIYEWNPDLLVLEGIHNMQMTLLDEYILSMSLPTKEDGSKKENELREAGLLAEQRDWDAVRRGTTRPINKFLNLHDHTRNKVWHKYVTVLIADARTDQKTKEYIPEGPWLQGAARKVIGSGFDLILQCVEKRDIGNKTNVSYYYKCVNDGTAEGKRRGLPVDPIEPADMEKLWKKITAKRSK